MPSALGSANIYVNKQLMTANELDAVNNLGLAVNIPTEELLYLPLAIP